MWRRSWKATPGARPAFSHRVAAGLVVWILAAGSSPAVPADSDCMECHSSKGEIATNAMGRAVSLFVDEAPFRASVHGELSCTDCHQDIKDLPHEAPPAPVQCAGCHEGIGKEYATSVHGESKSRAMSSGAAGCADCHGAHEVQKSSVPGARLHWQQLSTTCGKCHADIGQAYLDSVHGKAMLRGNRHAPVCTDCHGEHDLAAVSDARSPVSAAHIPDTCGECHAAARIISKYGLPEHSVDTYLQSFHGLSVQLGAVKAANCASCHSAHDILPSSDPRSSVHPERLPETCGHCHPGIGSRIASARIHAEADGTVEHQSVTYVRWFYYVMIAGILGGMFVHNLLDFIRKLRRHARAQRARTGDPRMSVGERIQHIVLIVTFVTLAYTGFALKFPHAWWAYPCVVFADWRGGLHRIAACGFVLLTLWHLVYVVFTARGRHHLRALCPAWSDFKEAWGMFLYYVNLRDEKPKVGFYSYVEKAEYWALVWGTVVMVVTGALMTWAGWTMRMFPKWVYDFVTAIHYYEAILATAAIVLWHFYFAIFDPDEYPMKMTWLSGAESEADQQNRRTD